MFKRHEIEGPLVRAWLQSRNGSPVGVVVAVGHPGGKLIPGAGKRANSDAKGSIAATLASVAAKVAAKAEQAGLPVTVLA